MLAKGMLYLRIFTGDECVIMGFDVKHKYCLTYAIKLLLLLYYII